MISVRSAIPVTLISAALALINPVAADAAVTGVSTQPELFPNFDSKVIDYVVKCGGGSVSFSAASTDSAKISLGGGTATKIVNSTVPLAVGQSFSSLALGQASGGSAPT